MVQGNFDTMSSYISNTYSYDSHHSSESERSYQRKRHDDSNDSHHSNSTIPTSYSSSPSTFSRRPTIIHSETCDGRVEDCRHLYCEEPEEYFDNQRASSDTCASTVASEEDESEDLPEYEVPDHIAEPLYGPKAIPAAPHEFSQLFPSSERMTIMHDDTTLDGNMNLRIDTSTTCRGDKVEMTLFHLRMHDLRNREFSLRRYGRDSGREVCHSVQMYQTPMSEKRPGLQRSLSNALNTLKPNSERKGTTMANLKRADSGYESSYSGGHTDPEHPCSSGNTMSHSPAPTNTIKLEFSNYAQVDVKRRGAKSGKHYSFEYWGVQYAWRREVRKDTHGQQRTVSYRLSKLGSDHPIAYIAPMHLSPSQEHTEREKGGWIAPCSMRIAEDAVCDMQKDLADVIVSSGLMALVDDSIKQRFHSKHHKRLLLPGKMGMEYVGPKKLINEVFGRRPSTSSGIPSHRPALVRHHSHAL